MGFAGRLDHRDEALGRAAAQLYKVGGRSVDLQPDSSGAQVRLPDRPPEDKPSPTFVSRHLIF
jgi:hypothetical protein